MLVLTRHKNESILLGSNVELRIVGIQGCKVRVGIRAPKSIPVHRGEVLDAILRDGRLSIPQVIAAIESQPQFSGV